jgi:hypothetical protein
MARAARRGRPPGTWQMRVGCTPDAASRLPDGGDHCARMVEPDRRSGSARITLRHRRRSFHGAAMRGQGHSDRPISVAWTCPPPAPFHVTRRACRAFRRLLRRCVLRHITAAGCMACWCRDTAAHGWTAAVGICRYVRHAGLSAPVTHSVAPGTHAPVLFHVTHAGTMRGCQAPRQRAWSCLRCAVPRDRAETVRSHRYVRSAAAGCDPWSGRHMSHDACRLDSPRAGAPRPTGRGGCDAQFRA